MQTVRHFGTASIVRNEGYFASADTCAKVSDANWVAKKLQTEAHTLQVGDLALIAEWAPVQWQRDEAVKLMQG